MVIGARNWEKMTEQQKMNAVINELETTSNFEDSTRHLLNEYERTGKGRSPDAIAYKEVLDYILKLKFRRK